MQFSIIIFAEKERMGKIFINLINRGQMKTQTFFWKDNLSLKLSNITI